MTAWIIESALNVSIILLVGVVSAVALRRQSAALRHWVLAVVMVCAWATPPLRMTLPAWLSAPLWRAADHHVPPTGDLEESTVAAATNAAGPMHPAKASAPRAVRASLSAGEVLGSMWIVGSLVSAFTLVAGLARLRWLASRADVIDAGPWYEVCDRVRTAYGLSSPIRLLKSDHPSLLITWGWLRPTVLLPAAADSWSRECVEVVLTHELAHVARRDWLWQVAAAGLRAVYWFNPLAWIASGRLRVESERACDDAVLASGIEGHSYATHLLLLARTLRHRREPWLTASAMARPSGLEGRIRAMLSTHPNRRPLSSRARAGTIGALVALTLAAASLRGQSVFFTITGTVLDPTDRVLPGTKLVLTNALREARYEMRSDATGRFEFVGLPEGTYTLEASVPGFATLKWQDISVQGDIQRDLRLSVGSLQETVSVGGGSALVVPDAVINQKREEARRGADERLQRALAQCTTTGDALPVGGNILAPVKLVNVPPIYPEFLKASKVAGTVTMDAVIGTDGVVRDIKNLAGPHPALESAAADAVRQWQFSTTLLNCAPIDVDMRVTVNFAVQR